MPAYSFHERFIADVEAGRKQHTIRAKRKNAPRVGQTFHAYYAMRNVHCRKLLSAPITKVEDIRIQVMTDQLWIWIESLFLDPAEVNRLAQADGFRSADDMAAWWRRVHGLGTFRGDVIHWDYDRRQGADLTAELRAPATAPTSCWRAAC